MDIMFTAISNDVHRHRRAPLSHFFSRRAVLELEDIIQDKARKLCGRVREGLDTDKPVDLRAGARAVSVDVITEYAFDNCWNHLDDDDFGNWFSEALRETGIMWWFFQQFPSLAKLMQAMPEDFARKTNPIMNGWLDCVAVSGYAVEFSMKPGSNLTSEQRTRDFVNEVRKLFEAGVEPKRRTIFHELMDPKVSDKDAAEPLTNERLYGEALTFCTAAADTTGNAIEAAAYHVITNPHIYETLTKELREAFPDLNADLDLTTLETLPYLTGVAKEGQR